MARSPIEKMTLKEIEDLEGRIAIVKAKAADASRAELKAKIDVMLSNAGFSIADLYPQMGRGRGRSKSAPKYVNPEDRSQTWTGRGRRPNWMVARLKKGAKMDDFTI